MNHNLGESEDSLPYQGESSSSASMMGDWSAAGGFFSSVLSGLLLGLAADFFLDTEPWLVVIGIVAGFTIGFWRMIGYSNRIIEQATNPRLERIAWVRRQQENSEDES